MRLPRSVRLTALAAALVAVPAGVSAAPAGAVTGPEASGTAYAATARLDIGAGTRACSGVLVDAEWLLTAKSCFVDNPAAGIDVPAGAPALKTTATIGRTDLTTTAGQVRDVVRLVPDPDQDLVLAKLASPVTGVTPVALSSSAPAAGEELRVAGYGRTKDEWAPLKLHTGAFTVDSVTTSQVSINGKDGAAVCAGDAGGPLLRDVNGTLQLVGVNSRSWQGGCFGADPAESRNGAVATRVDNGLRDWINLTMGPVCNSQGALYSLVSDGSLLRRNIDDPKDGTGTIPAATTIDTGWKGYGRVLAGPSATFYGIKSDGMYLSHRITSTATWDVHHKKISSSFTAYNTAANHNKISIDRSSRIWYVDDAGALHWSRYVSASGTWEGGQAVDTGWGGYSHIFAADDGVVYGIDSATGHLVRSRYDFDAQRWVQHQVTVDTNDWRATKQITSFGGDTVVRIKTDGDVRQYRYNEGTGTFDSWNKLLGSGDNWTLYTSVTASPEGCHLRIG
ncbi:MAG: trypsin-like serine protease [Streptomyces sp.]|nr:trypsin-like serine protease [Streptomyces sp.]